MHSIIVPRPAPSATICTDTGIISVPPMVGDDGQCLLRLSGEIDLATTGTVISEGLRCLEHGSVRQLIIGLGEVTFLDAGGLGALVVLRAAADNLGKDVELDQVPPCIERLLRLTGLDAVFDPYSTTSHPTASSDSGGPGEKSGP